MDINGSAILWATRGDWLRLIWLPWARGRSPCPNVRRLSNICRMLRSKAAVAVLRLFRSPSGLSSFALYATLRVNWIYWQMAGEDEGGRTYRWTPGRSAV